LRYCHSRKMKAGTSVRALILGLPLAGRTEMHRMPMR
jgi:hypothetical protein